LLNQLLGNGLLFQSVPYIELTLLVCTFVIWK